MYPILLFSIVALAIILERTLALRRTKIIPRPFLEAVRKLLANAQYQEIAFLSQATKGSAARLVEEALKLTCAPRYIFKESMEEAGRREALNLNAHLSILSLVGQVSPLLGLLGTVSGMIKAFGVIAAEGLASSGLLAGGISEALLTTAAGLTIAIPSLVAFRLLTARADQLVSELENLAGELLENLAAPEKRSLE